MKKVIILLTSLIIFLSLISCNDKPYRIAQMENGQYVIQKEISFSTDLFTRWQVYCDAFKCYRFDTKFEASEAYCDLMEVFESNKRANTIKEVVK